MKLSIVLRSLQGGRLAFWCPGCNEAHQVTVRNDEHRHGPVWGYNGNPDAPTFTPSILVRGTQIKRDKSGKWNGEWVIGPDGRPLSSLCHSFVRDGRIQFLSDCTHALAGQTVDLPPFNMEAEK